MTTNEIIEKLRDMSVAKMGPAEGVVLSGNTIFFHRTMHRRRSLASLL